MRRLLVPAALVLALVLPAVADATVIVPVSDPDLVAAAAAVVVGRVADIESHLDGRRIFTTVTVDVDEALKGEPVTRLVVKQPGGTVQGMHAWIEGSPEFQRGERVLLFLSENRDGTPRVLHLYQGKFSVVTDEHGEEIATHDVPDGVVAPRAVAGAGRASARGRALRDWKAAVREHGGAAQPRRGRAQALVAAAAPATAVTEAQASFTYLGSPSRWFEPDSGQAVRMKIDSSGEASAPGKGFEQVRAGFAAWSGAGGSSFRYADGGWTTAGGFQYDGVSAISFGDPLGDMDPPTACSGTLAYGGYFRSGETRAVNGRTFYRIVEGDIVFNDGWAGCGFYESYSNLAEVATHELGHVLGLDHSANSDATMYAYAQWDGRGAALRADDIAGLTSIYPASSTATPLTVAFTRPAAGASVAGTTSVGFAAAGGTGYTYRLALDGVTLYSGTSASYSWNTTTTRDGSHTLTVTVTDAARRTATTSRVVTVANATTAPPAPAPSGGLRVVLTQPKPGSTVTGTSWATVWVEGAAAGSKTFRLALGTRALATSVTSSSGPVSIAYNTALVANGVQTITATVSDGAGATGSASVGVTVSNAGSTPAPAPTPTVTAAFTSPAAGATVSGTVSVGMSLAGSTAATRTFQLAVDGAVVSSQSVTGSSATYAWDTRRVANGSHTLTLRATDSAGQASTATRTVSVANSASAPPPPTGTLRVVVTQPRPGVTVQGTVWPVIWVEGAAAGTKAFRLAVNGLTIATQTTSSSGPVSLAWNTALTGTGSRTLTATVTDATGNTGTTTVTVTVTN